jgi:hypothetical protein
MQLVSNYKLVEGLTELIYNNQKSSLILIVSNGQNHHENNLSMRDVICFMS